MAEPWHVVVDGGLDDALALGVLVGLRVPMAQVIATEGSIDLLATGTVTRRLMGSLGSSVPVRLGASSGLRAPYPDGRDCFHGLDGFGGKSSALRLAAAPDEGFQRLDGPVLCTGALTSVATGLRAGHRVSEVIWMGGAVAVGGNMTPPAEFNAWMDPPATDEVLTRGLPIRMVPLDVTQRVAWSTNELKSLQDVSPLGALYAEAINFIHDRDGSFTPHDAVAAISLVAPDLFAWHAYRVRCETSGIFTTGETVVDRRHRTEDGCTLVAEDIDVLKVNSRIISAVGDLDP